MVQILKELRIDSKIIDLIVRMYMEDSKKIQLEKSKEIEIEVTSGIRQGLLTDRDKDFSWDRVRDRDWSFWPGQGLRLNSYVCIYDIIDNTVHIFFYLKLIYLYISDLLSNLTLIL